METLFTREKCFQSEKCFHSNRSSENCFQTHEKTREKNEVIPVRIEQKFFLKLAKWTIFSIFNELFLLFSNTLAMKDFHSKLPI